MPFDVTFTEAEFEAAITADPKILDRVAPVLTKREYTVRDKTTNDTYENNLRKQLVDARTSEIATALEKDLEEFGIKKSAPEEKYFDLVKRGIKGYKEKAEALEAEIAPLRGKSNLSEVERQQLTEAKQALKDLKTDFEGKENGYKEQIVLARLEGKALQALGEVKATFLKTLTDDMTAAAENAAITKILKGAQINEQGQPVLQKDGKAWLDTTTLEPVTIKEALALEMKAFVDPGHKQTGTASKNRDIDPASMLPSDVKTRPQLVEWLLAKGLTQDSPEFQTEYTKYKGSSLPAFL